MPKSTKPADAVARLKAEKARLQKEKKAECMAINKRIAAASKAKKRDDAAAEKKNRAAAKKRLASAKSEYDRALAAFERSEKKNDKSIDAGASWHVECKAWSTAVEGHTQLCRMKRDQEKAYRALLAQLADETPAASTTG